MEIQPELVVFGFHVYVILNMNGERNDSGQRRVVLLCLLHVHVSSAPTLSSLRQLRLASFLSPSSFRVATAQASLLHGPTTLFFFFIINLQINL